MAELRTLKKRLKSIRLTGELSGVIKTDAAARFAVLSERMKRERPYSAVCGRALSLLGNTEGEKDGGRARRSCFVLLSHDRGFCGSFNDALLAFFEQEYQAEEPPPTVLAAGKKAAVYLEKKGIPYTRLEWKTVPGYEDAEKLAERLEKIYADGQADRVYILYQSYVNMLVQKPVKTQLLPAAGTERAAGELLLLPDRETVMTALARPALTDSVRRIMLEHAAGAQAATSAAMRSACDNAERSAEKLSLEINRIRQTQVTDSVLELSASRGDDAAPGRPAGGTGL